MREILYYLNGEALVVHEEKLRSVTDDPGEEIYGVRELCAWTQFVDALLKRFLTEEVLKEAYNSFNRATKREGEDEETFETRMSTRSC